MLGIDRPPLATTSASAEKLPCDVRSRNSPLSPCMTCSMLQWVRTSTPAAAHSSSSSLTISFDDSSQNSWPSSFSWYLMPWRSTSSMKCQGV